jgi:hypothetical protein
MTDRTMSAAASHTGPSPLGATAAPDWRVVAGGLALCVAAVVFGYRLTALSQLNDWWLDEFYSLFASDPGLGFGDLLRQRILTDSNPPLYYVLLFAVRRWIADPRTAILVLNGLAISATAIAVALVGRRQRVPGFALAGFAVFLISGPVLRFAVEGRSYLMALMVTYVAAWLAALALDAPAPRLAWWYWPLLGATAALVHVFAGLFCGCLAAALLVSALLWRRRDLIVPALTLGIAAAATLILWFLIFGSGTTARIAWIVFSADTVIAALREMKQTIFGYLPVAAIAVVFAATLCVGRTRPLAVLAGVTATLFLAVPCALSYAQPIVQGRYLAIGAPLVVVFLTFVARAALAGRPAPAGLRLPMVAGAGVVALLLAMDRSGFLAAQRMTAEQPFWRGAALAGPLLTRCGPASVHVNRPAWLFALAGHAPESTFVPIDRAAPAQPDGADTACPLLGWAEHIWQPEDLVATASDRQLLDLLRIAAPPADVTIVRHHMGYVVLRTPG